MRKTISHRNLLAGFIVAFGVLALSPAAYAACASPVGTAGEMFFNTDNAIMQYCDGNSWVGMAGGITAPTAGSGISTLTGDVSATGSGSAAATIQPGVVSYAKIQNTSAASVILGRGSSGGAGVVQELTLGSGLTLTGTVLSAAGAGADGATAGLLQFRGATTGSFLSDATANGQLFWDVTNHRLGVGTITPDASSVVDVSSTTKGMLPPRMTTVQRNAITTPATGLMIFNTTSSQMEFYNGTGWNGIGSMTAGTIAAFAATSCPSGWTEYTAARGRFLRGIDPSGATTIDPRGTVAPGTQQADAIQGHKHSMSAYQLTTATPNNGGAANAAAGAPQQYTAPNTDNPVTDGTNGTPRIAIETRPVNVAVIYCSYSGSGGGGGGSTTLAALSDVSLSTLMNGQVLKYNTTTSKWENGTGSGGSSDGATAGLIQFRGATTGSFLSDATANGQLFWDVTNHRLGVNTVTPKAGLQIGNTTGFIDFTASGTTYSTFANNAYWNTGTSTWKRTTAVNGAALLQMSTLGNVTFWRKTDAGTAADSDITFTQSLVIDASGTVGIGTNAADVNAILDVSSTTKGFLLPRMTTAQVSTLDTATNTNGMLVYDTDAGLVKVQTGGVFVTLGSGSTSGGTNTMVNGWPDAIQCYDGTSNVTLYMSNNQTGNSVVVYETANSAVGGTRYYTMYSSSGTYTGQAGMATYDCVTATKSIATLYSQNKAFNFIGNGSMTAAGAAGQVQFYEGGNMQADAGLTWDNVNKRLGVGTATPTASLQASTTGYTRVRADTSGSAGAADYVAVNDAGKTVAIGIFSSAKTSYWGINGNDAYILADAAGTKLKIRSSDALSLGVGATTAALTVDTSNNIGIGTTTPDANAILDVSSTTKGFLLPRMTTAQASTLDTATNTNGMLIYDTDTGQVKVQTGGVFVVLGSGSAGGGTNTMYTGWPDAITCTVTNPAQGTVTLYPEFMPYTNGLYYYYNHASSQNNGAVFNANGTFNSFAGIVAADCNVSIATLYGSGKAYKYIGNGSMTAAGAAGQVQFYEGGNMQADAGMVWDNVNKRLGVGTVTPLGELQVNSASASVQRGITSAQFSTDTNGARINLLKARGTQAAQTTVANADVIGNINFQAFGTTLAARASIVAAVNGAVSGDTVPTDLYFNTGTTGPAEAMRIDSNGSVGIGVAPTAAAHRLQVRTITGDTYGVFESNGNTVVSPRAYSNTGTSYLTLLRARGSISAPAAVQSGDFLGRLEFNGFDTSSTTRTGANIYAAVNGVVSSGVMPVDLIFQTASTAGLSERMRISNTGNIGIGTTAPDANAILDISSTTKGLLLPRMTTAQASTLDTATNANGMLIYDTDTGQVKVQTGGVFVVLGSGSGSGGTNTMISSWPDAVRCYGSAGSVVLYHSYYANSGIHSYISGFTGTAASDNLRVTFTSSGVWAAVGNTSQWTNYYETNCNASSNTIATLYSAGNAFNFIGNGSMTAAGAAGQVQFYEGGNMQADAGMVWDNVNKRLGLGTTAPDSKLTISNNAAALAAPPINTVLHVGNADSATTVSLFDAFGAATSQIILRRSKGTSAAPTALLTGEDMGSLIWAGYGGTSYNNASAAKIIATTAENWSDTTAAASLAFFTRPSLTVGGSLERMRIDKDGNIGIGTPTPNPTAAPSSQYGKVVTVASTDTGGGRALLELWHNTDTLAAGVPFGQISFMNGTAANVNAAILATGTTTDRQGAELRFYTKPVGGGTGTTGLVERLRLDSNGNLGLGTTAPIDALHILGVGEASGVTDAGVKTATLRIDTSNVPVGAGGAIEFGIGATSSRYYAAIKGNALNATSNSIGDLTFLTRNALADTGLSERMRITSAGNVGIGTAVPAVKLDVAGAIVSRATNLSAGVAVDWSTSNVQYTTASCGAFTFTNMQDGGSYSLAVKGTSSGTCSFSQSGLTFKYPPGHGATTASTHTVYSFLRAGTDVYITWIKGY